MVKFMAEVVSVSASKRRRFGHWVNVLVTLAGIALVIHENAPAVVARTAVDAPRLTVEQGVTLVPTVLLLMLVTFGRILLAHTRPGIDRLPVSMTFALGLAVLFVAVPMLVWALFDGSLNLLAPTTIGIALILLALPIEDTIIGEPVHASVPRD